MWRWPAIVVLSFSLSAWAAPAFDSNQCHDDNSGSTNTHSCTLTVAASALLVVAIALQDPTTVSSLTDGKSLTYTNRGATCDNVGFHILWYTAPTNAATGSDLVTLNLSGATTFTFLWVGEFTGLTNATPFDTSGCGTGSTNAMSTGNFTTANSGEMLIGYSFRASGASGNTVTPGSGYTSPFGSASLSNFVEYKVAGAAGTYVADGTSSGGTNWSFGAIALIAPATGHCAACDMSMLDVGQNLFRNGL